eukprot:1159197-Pelagomonas_calceolata.AAC.11
MLFCCLCSKGLAFSAEIKGAAAPCKELTASFIASFYWNESNSFPHGAAILGHRLAYFVFLSTIMHDTAARRVSHRHLHIP